jgi:FixJ family two-component response regulator
LLLTDISIGGLNGPDVARHLLASHKTDKVFFMSGADDPDIATLGKVVLKPFTLMSLLESVRGTIG